MAAALIFVVNMLQIFFFLHADTNNAIQCSILAFLIGPTLVVRTYSYTPGFNVCLTTLLYLFSNSKLQTICTGCSMIYPCPVLILYPRSTTSFPWTSCYIMPFFHVLRFFVSSTRRSNEPTAGIFFCFVVQVSLYYLFLY